MSSGIVVEASPSLVFCAKRRFGSRCALHEPVDDQYFEPAGIVSMATVSILSKLNPPQFHCTKPKVMDFSPDAENCAGWSEGCHKQRESTIVVACRSCTNDSPLDTLSMTLITNSLHHEPVCVVDCDTHVSIMGSLVSLH